MTIPYYLHKKGLIGAALCIEEQGCDAVLEEDEWRLLMRTTDTKQTGIASWGAIWEGWNTLQFHAVGYRMAKTCWLIVSAYEF
ncbi:hypothetical protein [Shewanella holmiensis]|uniref:Uncharacterized protein n=1 Tax=Shewanella holmiensis TaxID=2952222 RepID=A0A9X2WP57_9GAMM|nr:hypothetical protein [Shewanella holmiensis]MCT7942958.1 hypothetical protein [Shewanella holmiensis]